MHDRETDPSRIVLVEVLWVRYEVSDYLELLPGDALVSGTPAGCAIEDGPGGPYLRPGDRVEVEIEGVGVLTTLVGAP